MSLDEEIAIYQFGQGIRPADDLLTHVNQLDRFARRVWLFDFSAILGRLNLTNYELDQALAEFPPEALATPAFIRYINQLRKGLRAHLPESELNKYFVLLLQLFKTGYQRHYALEKDNPTGWQYQDLSSDETVRNIETAHQALVEKVYADPSFRTEFASIARHWHEQANSIQVKPQPQEPDPANQPRLNFLSYDEIVTLSVPSFIDRKSLSVRILLQSVEQALLKMYHLRPEQASRLTTDVVDRHMRDTYGTSLR
ncbi:DUF5958 family protein [Spirosoma aerophilum]